MIKVLQNWDEIGQAAKFLAQKELPKHGNGEKNWDLYQLHRLVEKLDRGARIIDLGCSGVHTLKFLHALGFTDLAGVDLHITGLDRLQQAVRMWRGRTLRRPFKLYTRDLTDTGFGGNKFDFAACVSVIEHGVNFEKFLAEASRLLKPGGLLFVTADYWEEQIDLGDERGEFALPWKILCRKDVEDIIDLAGRFGFELYENCDIPSCSERCILWRKKEFTFIAMVFRRQTK